MLKNFSEEAVLSRYPYTYGFDQGAVFDTLYVLPKGNEQKSSSRH